jgi:hypothetical protein
MKEETIRQVHAYKSWRYYYLKTKAMSNSMLVKFRINISTYQILSSVPSTFATAMPDAYNQMMEVLGVSNLNFAGLFPFSCSVSYDFMDQLFFATIVPIIFSCLLFLSCLIQYRGVARSWTQYTSKSVSREKVVDKYLTYFLYFTYLVFPSVSTTIFQTFLCTDIDPSHSYTSSGDFYLTSDMTISCSSSYYYNWRLYAILMIFVYPVGIPVLYASLLWSVRKEISSRPSAHLRRKLLREAALASSTHATHLDNSYDSPSSPKSDRNHLREELHLLEEKDDHVYSAAAKRLSFLWEAYEPQYWYWELIETTRRLILTAVISLITPGTSSQSVLSILLALLYIKLYNYCIPYEEDSDDLQAELGQFQIFFTFFVVLVIGNDLISNKFSTLLEVLLVLANVALLLNTAYSILKSFGINVAHLARTYRKSLSLRSPSERSYSKASKHHLSSSSIEAVDLELNQHNQDDPTTNINKKIRQVDEVDVEPFSSPTDFDTYLKANEESFYFVTPKIIRSTSLSQDQDDGVSSNVRNADLSRSTHFEDVNQTSGEAKEESGDKVTIELLIDEPSTSKIQNLDPSIVIPLSMRIEDSESVAQCEVPINPTLEVKREDADHP